MSEKIRSLSFQLQPGEKSEIPSIHQSQSFSISVCLPSLHCGSEAVYRGKSSTSGMKEQSWSSAIIIPGEAENSSDISEREGEGDEKVFSSCITSANGATLQLHILVKRNLNGLR